MVHRLYPLIMRKGPPSASLRLRPYIRRELDKIDTDDITMAIWRSTSAKSK